MLFCVVQLSQLDKDGVENIDEFTEMQQGLMNSLVSEEIIFCEHGDDSELISKALVYAWMISCRQILLSKKIPNTPQYDTADQLVTDVVFEFCTFIESNSEAIVRIFEQNGTKLDWMLQFVLMGDSMMDPWTSDIIWKKFKKPEVNGYEDKPWQLVCSENMCKEYKFFRPYFLLHQIIARTPSQCPL